MATVPHVTSDLGLRKFQADGFLLTQVYHSLSSISLKTSLATTNGAATSRAPEGPPSYARTLPCAETALFFIQEIAMVLIGVGRPTMLGSVKGLKKK